MPSMTSTSTTSPSSFSTAYCATLAPTLPAPTTVILGRVWPPPRISALPAGIAVRPEPRLQLGHVLDDGGAELGALDLLGTLHQPREVVRDHLLLDGRLEPVDDPVGRFRPPHVAEHHLAGEDHGAGIDLVLPRVLRRR